MMRKNDADAETLSNLIEMSQKLTQQNSSDVCRAAGVGVCVCVCVCV